MINQYLAAGAGVVPLGTGPPDFIIGAMNSFPITAVTTLPVIATRSIEFLKNSGTSLVSNRLRHFHFGGDYLSNARRRRVEKYFGVQCYDFYGLSEIFGPIAGECEEKNGLHVASDYVLVEVVNPHTKEHVREGEAGVAVYTTLWTKAAPLLRFWSDDYVSITWDRCRCGRTSPRIKYEGRPASGVIIRNRWIFAKNIEEIVMSFPECSDEFEIKIQGTIEKPTAKLYLEDSSHKIPIEEIEDNLEEFLGIPVKTEIVNTGFFSRENVKQGIITDTRLLGASK
jgi:phenylacetate-CoA ligase